MGIAKTLIGALVSIVEILLSLRFVFKFIGVNPQTPFVDWLYYTTNSWVSPFAGILPNFKLGGFMIDFSTLVALVIYVLIGYFILQIFPSKKSQYLEV